MNIGGIVVAVMAVAVMAVAVMAVANAVSAIISIIGVLARD